MDIAHYAPIGRSRSMFWGGMTARQVRGLSFLSQSTGRANHSIHNRNINIYSATARPQGILHYADFNELLASNQIGTLFGECSFSIPSSTYINPCLSHRTTHPRRNEHSPKSVPIHYPQIPPVRVIRRTRATRTTDGAGFSRM